MNGGIRKLEPLTFPLKGSHLIEASAGTGKTFTIALLYVRLVLGRDAGEDPHSFVGGRALIPPEVLVVTFTEAATGELRQRIRDRLVEAAACFRADPASVSARPEGEDPLHDLRAGFPVACWPGCASRLQLASEWMDEAAVSTIHGWCNRMLREHAFDSQSLFTQSLETDQTELLAEIVRDYWRNHYYPLPPEEAGQLRALWNDPAALAAEISPLLAHVGRLPPARPPAAALREKSLALGRLKQQPWTTWLDELEAILLGACEEGRVRGNRLRRDWVRSWLREIRAWATTPGRESLEIGAGWKNLTPSGIAEAWKEGNPPDHPAFTALAGLKDALENLPRPKEALLAHAACWVARRFAGAKEERAEMGFDDLLSGLDDALAGRNGDRLADTIRRQFPVALIDEFQDTDPVQYRIFERIYEIARNRQDCALILIGDPKQAIYAFRGADIHTYLKARRAVAGRLHTLDQNFRSTRDMVAAVNRCFGFIESREEGPGAFLFRTAEGNPLPFLPAAARGRSDFFRAGETPAPALIAALAPEEGGLLPVSAYRERMSEICATRIVDWLGQGQRGEAGFDDGTGRLTPLRPGDLAILVNNGNEAKSIRTALARRGVRSVYLSDKDSVFRSPQTTEVRRWLCACAEPDDDRLLRAALSTPTLGLSFQDLEILNEDEIAWENLVIQFRDYREIWRHQGVLPMLRRLLLDFGCNQRLLAAPPSSGGAGGERILTDLLHLAEWLQQASHRLEGEHALIRFYDEQLAAPGGEADGRRLRLESDEDLVSVITIHKSKGLEYPLVFLPFLCATRVTRRDDLPLKWHDGEGELHLELGPQEQALEAADRERLGEDLRKTYVALTRARYLTWIGLAPLKEARVSAIGHLLGLGGPGEVTPVRFGEALKAFSAGVPGIAIEESPACDGKAFVAEGPGSVRAAARHPARAAGEAWWIGSYSALRTVGPSAREEASARSPGDTPRLENLRESLREVPSPADGTAIPREFMHRFTKGAEAGSFLHELLEWIGRYGFAAVLDEASPLRETIERRCRLRGREDWIGPLEDWMRALLTTPLKTGSGPAESATLRLVDLAACKVEMEFCFETRHVDLARLDRLVQAHTLGGKPRPALVAETQNGMLKGFMDLVFEHEGRYYVADYKSNWLGPRNEAYGREEMEAAILGHRYDLQYVLYLFALHRLLQSRLPDYDYDRHVGGALYLFLRGIAAPSAGVHFERPPATLMAELDSLFRGA